MAVAAVVVHVLLLAVQETATGTAGALLMVATVVAAVVAVAADAVVAAEDAVATNFQLTYSYLFIIGGSQFFVL